MRFNLTSLETVQKVSILMGFSFKRKIYKKNMSSERRNGECKKRYQEKYLQIAQFFRDLNHNLVSSVELPVKRLTCEDSNNEPSKPRFKAPKTNENSVLRENSRFKRASPKRSPVRDSEDFTTLLSKFTTDDIDEKLAVFDDEYSQL